MISQAGSWTRLRREYLLSFREFTKELRTASKGLEELVRVSPQHASDLSVSVEYRALNCILLKLPEHRAHIPIYALEDRISAATLEMVTLSACFRANACRLMALVDQHEEAQETRECGTSLYHRMSGLNKELSALNAAKRAEAIKQTSALAKKDVASEEAEAIMVSKDLNTPASDIVTASCDSKGSSSVTANSRPPSPETPSINDAPVAPPSETSAEEGTASADEGQVFTASPSPSDSIVVDEVVEAPPARGLHDLHANGIKYFDVKGMKYVKVLGHGSSGVVQLVKRKNKDTDRFNYFAMKVMRADNSDEEAEIMKEVAVLEHLQGHSSAAQLLGAAYQHGKVHLLFELCCGGDLVARIREGHEKPITTNCGFVKYERVRWQMDEKQVRFYAAGLIKSISELHRCNIVHGDVKPDNIALDSKGYPKLVDLGLAGYLEPGQKHRTALGTWEYVPPEVARMVLGCDSEEDGIGRAADWWAVGITVHEMLLGKRPFHAVDSQGHFDKEGTLRMIAEERFNPSCVSDGALRDLLIGLLDPDPTTRLGAEGAERPEDHPFFKDIKWDLLAARTLPSPWQPERGSLLRSEDVHVPADHPAMQEYWVLGLDRRHSC